MQEAKTVVIGGGLAGLAAATYLARDGNPVSVLEKAHSLGGRAATETPHGFALNRGAHAFYGGGPGSHVLRELGIKYTFGSPRGYVARDVNGLHAFPAGPLDLLRTSLLDAADKADLLRVFARLGTVRADSLGHTSTATWIAQNTHRPRVRRVLESVARVSLYSAALDIASADVFVLRVQQSLKHPVQYIDGGWQTLVDGLRSAAQSAGAEILTSASAASIEIDDGAATHVVLHDGRVIGCSAVIVAAPPEDVSHLLTEAVAPRLHHMLTELVPTHIACLDLALERLPVARNAVVFDIEQPRFLTAQSAFAQLAPDNGAVVHLMLQLDPRQSGDPARERGALEALMDEVQPGWRELCVERRFLPRMLASSTLPLAGSGGLAGRPPVVCPDLANVYVAGDWIGADGYLADAALGSAREAARLAMTRQPRRALLAA